MGSLPRAYFHLPTVEHKPIQVAAFEVLRQPYGIETARVLTLNYTDRLMREVEPGTAVVLRWGSGPDMQEIYGYVYELRPEIRQLQRAVEIVITGLQHPLTWVKQVRSFPVMGPHNVVAEIIDDYRLVSHISPAPVQEIPDQDNLSDWQYIADLARRLGYVLLCVGTEIVFAPVDGYWRQSLRHQTYAATFRNTLTHQANLRTFERSQSPMFTLLDQTSSPFATDTNFTEITTDKWSGSRALEVFGALFPSSATATLLGPGRIYPLDAFDVTIDVARASWAVMQVKYVLTMDDYFAELVLGGDEQYYPGQARNTHDVSFALQWRKSVTSRPPVLKVTDQVRSESLFPAHWEAAVVAAPGTKEESWLVGL